MSITAVSLADHTSEAETVFIIYLFPLPNKTLGFYPKAMTHTHLGRQEILVYVQPLSAGPQVKEKPVTIT